MIPEWEAETGGAQVLGQPRLHSKTLSQTKVIKKKKNFRHTAEMNFTVMAVCLPPRYFSVPVTY
jgi:hypothetical protein